MGQRGGGDVLGLNESFDQEFLALGEDTKIGDRGNHSREFFAQAIGEHLEDFQGGELFFGIFGVSFGEAAMSAELFEQVVSGKILNGFFREAALEIGLQEAMDRQVGIASDGAGEMAIVFTGQGKMTQGSGAVFGAGEAFEDGQIDKERFGFAFGAIE